MKITAEVQIYNNQEKKEGSVVIVGNPEAFSSSNLVDLVVEGEVYEVCVNEMIAALTRAGGKVDL